MDAIKGARDMLKEAAKQFRLLGDDGHAAMCERHTGSLDSYLRENLLRELNDDPRFQDWRPEANIGSEPLPPVHMRARSAQHDRNALEEEIRQDDMTPDD